ncbi:MAG TPA: hypothetical protein PL124_12970 [Candidatus Cloacimonadota bacterium]|nr:hypothetical protein [Candidatus Cloacimonadota bacterium]
MKYFTLIALTLLTTAQVWAGPIVFGEVKSEIAGDFLNMLKVSANRDEIFTWKNTDIFSVIQITDQGTYDLTDGIKTMVSVTLGFSEDNENPEALTFGKFYNYTPLKTMVILLDNSTKEESLAEAMYLLDDTAEKLAQDFSEAYVRDQRKSFELTIQAELVQYACRVVQWYKTPRSQGGAGYSIPGKTKADLAEFLGFDSTSFCSNGSDVMYSIVKMNSSGVTLGGTPLDDSYSEGPLFFEEITFSTCEIMCKKNPVYGEE